LALDLEFELAKGLLEVHPIEAAQALERLASADVAALFAACEPKLISATLRRMAPGSARAALAHVPKPRVAELLAELPLDVSSRLLRSSEPAERTEILQAMPAGYARSVTALLRFPERTAGSLMDPDVLALPQEMKARDAVDSIRKAAHHAHYNVYVIDRDHKLVGVVNLRELLLARGGDPLGAFMQHPVRSLSAHANRQRIASDRGWREVHSLPVVDEAGVYLGAIRYRTLRRIESELQRPKPAMNTTSHALGDLFRAGAVGLVDAIAGPEEESNGDV